MITIELLQEMMAGKMLWISDGSYHHNAEIKGCSINKDSIIPNCTSKGTNEG